MVIGQRGESAADKIIVTLRKWKKILNVGNKNWNMQRKSAIMNTNPTVSI